MRVSQSLVLYTLGEESVRKFATSSSLGSPLCEMFKC
jgi:hypothetical protein